MTRRHIIVVCVAATLVLLWYITAWKEWKVLVAGYRLTISTEALPTKAYDIVFPLWRKALTILLTAIVAGGTVLLWMRRERASTMFAIALVLAVATGAYDLGKYGTLGSPTTWQSILLLTALFAVAAYGRSGGKTLGQVPNMAFERTRRE